MTLAAAVATSLAVALVFRWVMVGVRSRNRPKPKRAGWLKESGLDITPGQFWLASLGAGFGDVRSRIRTDIASDRFADAVRGCGNPAQGVLLSQASPAAR